MKNLVYSADNKKVKKIYLGENKIHDDRQYISVTCYGTQSNINNMNGFLFASENDSEDDIRICYVEKPFEYGVTNKIYLHDLLLKHYDESDEDFKSINEARNQVFSLLFCNADLFSDNPKQYDANILTVDYSHLDTSIFTMGQFCFTNVNLNGLILNDVSNFIYMSYMFYESCIPILYAKHWDTSNVTDMSNMFNKCKIFDLDAAFWNTSNVTDMSNMFSNCNIFDWKFLAYWDVSNVVDMSTMFSDCFYCLELNLDIWDVSNVKDIYGLFRGMSSLKLLTVSTWNTSNVVDMSFAFSNCESIDVLDLSEWNTSNVTKLREMFSDCPNLETLYLDNFDMSKVTNMNGMFNNCNSLNYIRCKQTFKDWCWKNQDTIKLPNTMREGSSGTWELIDGAVEPISLIIETDKEISWDETQINYTIEYKYNKTYIYQNNKTETKVLNIERTKSIKPNNDYENDKEYVLTFEKDGLTATKTVIQKRKFDKHIEIENNGGWNIVRETDELIEIHNDVSFDTFEPLIIKTYGYLNLKVGAYIRSYGAYYYFNNNTNDRFYDPYDNSAPLTYKTLTNLNYDEQIITVNRVPIKNGGHLIIYK